MKMVDDVCKFMIAADQLAPDGFPFEDGRFKDLYIKLIEEEYGELFEARLAGDPVEELDACLDLIWVIIGHMLSKGWNPVGGWNEVARSNHAKINPETDKMDRREDGKVIKPAGWTPPFLNPYLNYDGPYLNYDGN